MRRNVEGFCIEFEFQMFLEFSLHSKETETEIMGIPLLAWLIKVKWHKLVDMYFTPLKCHNCTSKD